MSIQATLATEYVVKVKKLPESRGIDPTNSKTMKDLKLKVVNCISTKVMHFLSRHHDGFTNAHHSQICVIVFQCPDDTVLAGDETIHILSHYTNCPFNKMQWYLERWMKTEKHDDFVRSIASDSLCHIV